jgi:hypothetical protein
MLRHWFSVDGTGKPCYSVQLLNIRYPAFQFVTAAENADTFHSLQPSSFSLPEMSLNQHYTTMHTDSDITILSDIQQTLEQNPDASQREIAQKSSLSLGMTNAVLRRFADKGWIMMKKLSSHTIRYVLTPTGMNALVRRSMNYMQRTFSEIREYGETVRRCIQKAKASGCTQAVLYGESDITFLIDYACREAGLPFRIIREPEQSSAAGSKTAAGIFCIIGEHADSVTAKALQQQGWTTVYDLVGEKKYRVNRG